MAGAEMTRSATEQPDVTVPAGPAVTLGPTVQDIDNDRTRKVKVVGVLR